MFLLKWVRVHMINKNNYNYQSKYRCQKLWALITNKYFK